MLRVVVSGMHKLCVYLRFVYTHADVTELLILAVRVKVLEIYIFYSTGIQIIRGKGNARVYPYDANQMERTHNQMELYALEALEKTTPQYGVKGPSILSKISHFDLVSGFVPDFLHCALLGVARQLVGLWFESRNHEDPWYIGQPSKQSLYDGCLHQIVVPKEIRRLPRSIGAREHWKANEYKTFVLYYSLIVLRGILPSQFLNHYFLFVWSVHKLLGTTISSDDLSKVEAALDVFIVKMEELYGIGNCTFNVHQLSHLVKSTKMCGPLWAVSTFTFESNNGTLKKMIQGTQYVSDQVCQTYSIMKHLPVFMQQSVQGNGHVCDVLEKLIHGKIQTRRAVKLGENLVALSKVKVQEASVEEMVTLTEAAGGVVNNILYEYNRFIWNGTVYDTDQYKSSAKRKNCYIEARHQARPSHFKIKGLVTIKKCTCPIRNHEQCGCCKNHVLICMPIRIINNRLYRCADLNLTSDFISEILECPELVVALQLSDIVRKCVKVEHATKLYLIDMPNMIEME